MDKYYLGICIVLIILILWYMCSINKGFSDTILTGFWVANDSFLQNNNISNFNMAIGPVNSGKRTVYIVMQDLNSNIIVNENNTMKLKSTWSSSSPSCKKIKYTIVLDNATTVMPQSLQMIYDVTSGFITLYDSETIYAELYKDNILSDMKTETDSADKSVDKPVDNKVIVDDIIEDN